jgi:hypothetical protein
MVQYGRIFFRPLAITYLIEYPRESGQVQRAATPPLEEIVQCLNVRICDVVDMNRVAHAGAVQCVVIFAKNTNRRSRARGLEDEENKVSFGIVHLANFAVRVCTRIKIAQCDPRRAASNIQIREQPLNEKLRMALRIDGMPRIFFRYGNTFWDAVDGAA